MIKLKPMLTEKLSKSSLETMDKSVINDIHKGYYSLGDALKSELQYALMKASQDDKAWKAEYTKLKKIKAIFDTMETGKIL